MLRNYSLLFLLFCFGLNAQDQWRSFFDVLEDYNTRDEIKMNISKQLTDALVDQLKADPDFAFDESLPWRKVATNDGSLSIYTWHYTWQDATSQYGGVVYNEGKTIPLVYNRTSINDQDKYSNLDWGGGVYYNLIPVELKGEKMYTLLAWDGNNGVTYKKYVEVLSFDRKGMLHFGAPIFEDGGRRKRRTIMEYSSDMSLLLDYNADEDCIITNALHCNDQRFSDVDEYYSASDAFNVFRYEKGLWVLYKNVDLRMNKKESKRLLKSDKKASSGL